MEHGRSVLGDTERRWMEADNNERLSDERPHCDFTNTNTQTHTRTLDGIYMYLSVCLSVSVSLSLSCYKPTSSERFGKE